MNIIVIGRQKKKTMISHLTFDTRFIKCLGNLMKNTKYVTEKSYKE